MSAMTMTGIEKAAVLLHSLPAEVVEKVLKHMNAQQAKLLTSVLAKVRERSDLKDIVSQVLDEASEALTGPPKSASTQPRPASRPSPQVDIRVSDDVKPAAKPEPPPADPMGALAKLPGELLAEVLESESPRTIAILLGNLEVEVAGQVYKNLTPAKRKEVSKQFTNQPEVQDVLLKNIAHAVLRKCEALRAVAAPVVKEPDAREKRMATLLRNLERTERMELMTVLEETDPELAARVKERLYSFDDILRMENSSVQKLLTEVDTKSLATSLAGAADGIRDRILANLSKRAQESLREEIELSGKVPAAKVAEARKSIVDAIQRLDQRGELVLTEEP